MEKQTRKLVDFYELPTDWQLEAISNHDDLQDIACLSTYIEPLENTSPNDTALLDLDQFIRVDNSEFDAIMTWSNCCAIGLTMVDCDTVELTYI